jgi:hypothetical protein
METLAMSETDRGKGGVPESPLQRLRRTAVEALESQTVKDALDTAADIASRGGHTVASAYKGVKHTVTQEEAWGQMESSIEEVTSVVRVQHAMILDLLDRVARLEAVLTRAEE